MLVDCHAHLDFFENLDFVNSFNGIIITNSVHLDSMKKNLELIKKYKNVKLALGVYPLHCLEISDSELDKQIGFIKENKEKIIAIGEVGIDFKENLEKEKQINNFKKFIKLAEEINKPLIVHSRGACNEVLDLLKGIKVKVILHYFNANSTTVKKALDLGFYFSVPTVLSTNKNMKKLVKIVPLDKILTETDAPYLSPIKDQKNVPENVKYTINEITKIKNINEKDVEEQIYKNYKIIFE